MLDVLHGPQSIQKKTSAGSGELPCLVIFRDFVVHCAVLRDSKLEKGSKKVPQLWFEPRMYCYASAENSLDFHVYSPIQCFGGKTGLTSYSPYDPFMAKS